MGDAFLVTGTPKRVRALARNPDYVVLTDQSQAEDVTRAPLAILILLIALVPSVFFDFPLPISAMGGALLMIVTRCISRSGLRRCMDWSVLCLIIGTLPLGLALEKHDIGPAQLCQVIGDRNTDGDPHAHTHGNRDAYANRYSHADGNAHGDLHTDSDFDSDSNTGKPTAGNVNICPGNASATTIYGHLDPSGPVPTGAVTTSDVIGAFGSSITSPDGPTSPRTCTAPDSRATATPALLSSATWSWLSALVGKR